MVQWAELPSTLSLSITLSPVARSVAGSRIWSDVLGSGSGAILSTVAPLGDGSSVEAVSGSCSTQQGDGGLGSGSSRIPDRGSSLSRHRTIASLQFSLVVSGRSTGRWQLAPILNRDFSISSTKVVVMAKRLKSLLKSSISWLLRARAVNLAACSTTKNNRNFHKN